MKKMDKRGGYSDYCYRGLCYSSVSFWFQFCCFVDSFVLSTSPEKIYVGSQDF